MEAALLAVRLTPFARPDHGGSPSGHAGICRVATVRFVCAKVSSSAAHNNRCGRKSSLLICAGNRAYKHDLIW
jgi:hypothetical protein